MELTDSTFCLVVSVTRGIPRIEIILPKTDTRQSGLVVCRQLN